MCHQTLLHPPPLNKHILWGGQGEICWEKRDILSGGSREQGACGDWCGRWPAGARPCPCSRGFKRQHSWPNQRSQHAPTPHSFMANYPWNGPGSARIKLITIEPCNVLGAHGCLVLLLGPVSADISTAGTSWSGPHPHV